MKCQACNTEISDKLKACLSRNFCPFCGDDIMSPQILQLKTLIRESIIKVSSSENMKNLDSLEVIDAFSAILAADIATFVSAKASVQPGYVSGEMAHSVPVGVQKQIESLKESSMAKDAEQGSGVVVPAHMKPANKKAPKAVTRGGERLPSNGVESPGLSLHDLKNLEDSLSGDIFSDLGEGDAGGFQSIDDSEFFNAGNTDDVTVAEVDGESVMLGMSNSGIKERAMASKQKYDEIKRRGGIKGVNSPVSRSG